MILHPDKYGFYEIGNFKTYSTREAFEISDKYKKPVQWNFNHNVFSKIDTTKEPEPSLLELYKMRCRQIRSAYDYVVLMYSGGSDSHNILMQWIEADCKIDEVVTLHRYSGTKDKDSFSDAEQFKVVLPHIEELQKTMKFKFTLFDQTEDILHYIDNFSLDMNYLNDKHITPNNSARSILRQHNQWKSLIESGKKVCFVWGKDKVRVVNRNDTFYLTFQDIVDDVVNNHVIQNYYNGWYDELFYWTPDLPELPIKIAHILKTYMRFEQPSNLQEYLSLYCRFNGDEWISSNDRLHSISSRGYKTLMYPYWNNSIFDLGKSSTGHILSERDKWLWESNLNQKDIFIESIKNTVRGEVKYYEYPLE